MRDTPVETQAVLRSRFRSLSPEERLRMASSMLAGARELGRAGAQAAAPGSAWGREQVLRYLYSGDLSPDVITAAARRLRRGPV